MWIIWYVLFVWLSIMGVVFYGWWHNRQVDKYNEWVKEHGEEEEAAM